MTLYSRSPGPNILVVSPYGPRHLGGVENVVESICHQLITRDFNVTWCTSDTTLRRDIKGLTYLAMKKWGRLQSLFGITIPIWSLSSLAALRRAVRDADIVHIHGFTSPGCILAVWMAKASNKRVVITLHSPIFGIAQIPWLSWITNPIKYALGWCVFPWTDEITTVGGKTAESLRTWFRASPTIIRNGIDRRTFPQSSPQERTACRSALGWSKQEFVCLFSGRFVTQKGLPIIRSIAGLRKHWTFVLVGSGNIDPRDWMLPNVRVVDAISDQRSLSRYYRAADVLLLPSSKEGFSLTMIEALASGLPVILTENLGMEEICHEDICIFVPPSTGKWIDAIESVQSWDPEKRERLCSSINTSAWAWPPIIDQYVALYGVKNNSTTNTCTTAG